MTSIIIKAAYVFIMALVLAILEVQVGGPNGWAKDIPTWRSDPKKWYAKLYKKLMSGKELTRYHLSMFSFVFLIFHLPFFFDANWSLLAEIDVFCVFLIFVVIWDYLWFIVNPNFTIKNFKGDHIFWHSKWFFSMPRDYWGSIGISFIIAVIADQYFNSYLKEWLIFFVTMLVLTIIAKWFIKIVKPEWE